jgi:hypothetical protein
LDEYHESYADGLQVLRYNKTTAYIPHMDWIDDPQKREEHNYDSSGVGTNRYATILLYMSNITDGGETVFKKAWPNDVPQSQRKTRQVSLEEVRRDGTVDLFKRGSWEESMVADCRSRLVIRPYSARAVLFYSQHPNGEEDTSSLHGGCPVLEGEKWAANLWVSVMASKYFCFMNIGTGIIYPHRLHNFFPITPLPTIPFAMLGMEWNSWRLSRISQEF